MCSRLTLKGQVTRRTGDLIPKNYIKVTNYQDGKPIGYKQVSQDLKLDGFARIESKEYWKNERNFSSGYIDNVDSYCEKNMAKQEVQFNKEGKIAAMINEKEGVIRIITRNPLTPKESDVHHRHPLFTHEISQILKK